MNIYKETGKKIHDTRIKLGITQEQLAQASGVSSNFISQIERGRNKCSLETVYRIAAGLKIPLSEMFDFVNPAVKSDDIYLKKINILIKDMNRKDRNLLYEITEDVYRKLKKK